MCSFIHLSSKKLTPPKHQTPNSPPHSPPQLIFTKRSSPQRRSGCFSLSLLPGPSPSVEEEFARGGRCSTCRAGACLGKARDGALWREGVRLVLMVGFEERRLAAWSWAARFTFSSVKYQRGGLSGGLSQRGLPGASRPSD